LSQRIYRDPVHNIIPLREDTAEGRLMVQLVDAVEFNGSVASNNSVSDSTLIRVRSIHASLHSLGALHLMTRILGQLSDRT
jgi:hypothetical protein